MFVMLINNLFLNRKQYTNNNNTHKFNPKISVNFTGKADILSREIKLEADDIRKISLISEAYDKILQVFSSFNGIYQKKFKSMYPDIVEGERIKGFVFKNIFAAQNKHLQIVRFNTKSNSDEILTFGVLDTQNKNLIRYRVNKSGNVLISADKNNISELSVNPFDTTKNINYKDYLNRFFEEICKFRFYSENFTTINHRTLNSKKVNVHKVISNIRDIQQSSGIKEEIDNIVKNYNELAEVLNFNHRKEAPLLKKEFFGDANTRAKGLVFKNLEGTKNKTVAFCLLTSKEDNRLFKVVIYDSNNKLENTFVFFSDGKVATQKKLSEETNDFRPNNLVQISDNEINRHEIKNIFEALNKQFAEFKNFITEKRSAQQEIKQKQKSDLQTKNIRLEEQKQELLKQKQEAKALKKLEKEKEKRIQLEHKKQAQEKAAETAKLKKEEALKRKTELEAKKEAKKLLKEQKAQALKLQKQEDVKRITQPEETQTLAEQLNPKNSNIVQQANFTNYRDLRLWKVTQSLNDLFSLPVENRSPHLIHERLSGGKIFAGRFTVKSSDGADIVVSRIKSPKYVDFTYYSIKIKKDGKEFTLNLDPETSKILLSKEGKPIVNTKNMVSYISKDEYLSSTPDAEKLPKYLNEIFENRTAEKRQYIKSNSGQKTQALLKQKEQDIIKALQSDMDID